MEATVNSRTQGSSRSFARGSEALLQERPAFVIDEVGEDEAEGDEGTEGAADVEELGDVVDEAQAGEEAEGLLSGREAQRAKELRSAPAQ